MPLHDTFKKKGAAAGDSPATTRVAPLRKAPTREDLRFCMAQASQSGRPSALSWRVGSETYILTVSNSKSGELSWVLHAGDEQNSIVLWSYSTADTDLILSFLDQINDPDKPKAVIPDSLRPGTEPGSGAAQDLEGENEDSFPLPHEEFADKYEILSRVGSGGMGVIFKARRKDTREIVALKLLHGHLLDDPENTKRFMQEASACSQLKHRNLISVYEYGVSRRGQPYMIMEFLEGRSLAELIKTEGKLELPRFINLFTQICDGLQCAHEKGVVHRDVKPSNVMIVNPSAGGRESAKVLDFGIAKFIVESEHKLTPTGNVLGSPAYIAPEQCAGGNADPRCDVYAIGCVMYEALAGRPPFVHESAIKVLLMQLGDPPPPLSSLCEEGSVPEDLENIIMHCLEKEPENRYASASDLATELWAIAALRSQGLTGELQGKESGRTLEHARPAAASLPGNAGSELRSEPAEMQDQIDADFNQETGQDANLSEADDSAYEFPVESSSSQESAVQEYAGQDQVNSGKPPDLQVQSRGSAASLADSKEKSPSRAQAATLTLRFRKSRSNSDLDGIWEGLNLAARVLTRRQSVSIFLDSEAVMLVTRMEIVAARQNLDASVLKRLSAAQAQLRELMKAGVVLLASQRWAKRGTAPQDLMPGVLLIDDDEICELILERKGSIIDY